MYGKPGLKALLACALCFMLVSCSSILQVNATVSPSAAPTASAAAGAAQSPAASTQKTASTQPATKTPSPTPSPSPSPTASPAAPTPTADPWAAFFSPQGPWISVADWDKGPWIYKDQALSITIERRMLGSTPYFRAEVYTRGPLPFGGFAYQDASARRRALPYLIARQNNAILGITGDFVIIGNNPKGVMIRNGRVYKDKAQAPTMAVMPDGELKVFDAGKITAKQLLDQGVKDSFAFGPILVRDGKINKAVYTNRLRPHNWRASIGMIEKGHYIIIVNQIGVDMAALAQLYVDNGCSVAYNMDGGHSTSIVFMGEQLYKQAPGEDNGEQRSLSDLLMIGTSPDVPAPGAPVYCNGLGYNKQYRPQPTNGPLN